MAAEDAVIFIDSNIYLALYGTVNGKELLGLLEEVREHVFVTEQVVDEVQRRKLQVAKEFFEKNCPDLKSEEVATNYSGDKLPDHLFDKTGSTIESIREKLKEGNRNKVEANKRIHEASKIFRQAVANTLRGISISDDLVSTSLKPLFDRAIRCTPDELRRAEVRRLKGNPPGSSPSKIGDQLNWEQLLSHLKAKRIKRVWIISKDSDYYLKDGDSVFLNPLLRQELLASMTPTPEILTYEYLLEGIRSFIAATGVEVSKFPAPETEDAFKKEQEALRQNMQLLNEGEAYSLPWMVRHADRGAQMRRAALQTEVQSLWNQQADEAALIALHEQDRHRRMAAASGIREIKPISPSEPPAGGSSSPSQ
jgi:hypothetical protein